MSIKEKLRNPFVQQYLLEVLFPILGFYFFDWNLLIIAVFYLVDQLASEIMFVRRTWWINKHAKKPRKGYFIGRPIILFLIFFLIQILGCYMILIDNFSIENLPHDFIAFPGIMDFVIEELWFLFPLVLAVYYIKDLFNFYMPRRYLGSTSYTQITVRTFRNLAILVLVLAFFKVAKDANFNDHVVLFSFIVGKIIFDITYVRSWGKHAL